MSNAWVIGICVFVGLLMFATIRYPVLRWRFHRTHGTSRVVGEDDRGTEAEVNLYSLVIAPLLGVVALLTALWFTIKVKDEKVREVHLRQLSHDQQTRRITKLQRALREWKLERVIVSPVQAKRSLQPESVAEVEKFLGLLSTQVDEMSVPPDAACGEEAMASSMQVVLVPGGGGRENVTLSLDGKCGTIAADVGVGDGAFLLQVPAALLPKLKRLAEME